MRWNPANRRIRLPIRIWGHANRHDGLALGKIKGQLTELSRLDGGNAVLGQKVMNHFGILNTDEEPKHTEHARRHTEVEPDEIRMPCARAGTGPDNHFMTR